MSGISSPIQISRAGPLLEIAILRDSYNIGPKLFERTATDRELEMFTDEVLDVFGKIEQAIKSAKSVTLPSQLCQQQLSKLAGPGMAAYRRFFRNDRARQILAHRLRITDGTVPIPTFFSDLAPFPWEVLYEGDDYGQADPEKFWGLRYIPARILNPGKDISDYPEEQSLPSDMLFCLHHKLLHVHNQERPEIEKLVVRSVYQDRFCLLGPACGLIDVNSTKPAGEDLIKYLYTANHNMVHFACHCKEGRHGDMLLISFIKDENAEDKAQLIELETYSFDRVIGQFQCRPLVFLNACQSAGGSDDLRKTFNLPKAFIECGAAAVIATACPVPDLFAAAFARVFYEFFLRGQPITDPATGQVSFSPMTIGEALRAARWHFLKIHHNPLGLAYGLYSPAYYRLARSLDTGGVL